MYKRSRRQRRRPMSDINVVPYIDVMLVLLVIFMVTAPLITQGVKVNLPQGRAGAVSNDPVDSVVITIDQFGKFYVDVGKDKMLAVEAKSLHDRIRTVLEYNPKTPVLVRADTEVDYGQVMLAMLIAQRAGAPNVGLIVAAPARRGP